MSHDHTRPQQQLGQQQNSISSLREPVSGPGGDIEATATTANSTCLLGLNRNANLDDDTGGKMFLPGAGQSQSINSNSSSCNSRNSPNTTPAAPLSQFLGGGRKRARQHSDSSDSGPPPKRTLSPEGGGHSVKRVGTDTLHPPYLRRDTGDEVHEAT